MGTAEEATNGDVKSDQEALTELDKKIIRQVEYYFGNYNIVKDRFLQEQIKLDNGWVPLEIMVKFNRLKALSTDFEVIVNALKKSPSKLMEVSEDGLKIRRVPDNEIPVVDDAFKEEVNSRSAYVKGFPVNATLDELLQFFNENSKNVENVYMRRNPNTKTFKGSVFVTFKTKNDSEAFLKTSLKYKDRVLLLESKPAYVQRKKDEYQQRQESKTKKAEEKQAAKESTEDVEMKDYPKDCILKLTGLSENTKWEDIKDFFKKYGTVAYVDYNKGTEAFVRFEEGTSATEVVKKVTSDDQKTVKIGESDVVPVALEGDDEVAFWKDLFKKKKEMKQRSASRHGQKKGKQRFGGKNKKNNRDRDTEDEPAKKKMKVEKESAPESEKMEAESSSTKNNSEVKGEGDVSSSAAEETKAKEEKVTEGD